MSLIVSPHQDDEEGAVAAVKMVAAAAGRGTEHGGVPAQSGTVWVQWGQLPLLVRDGIPDKELAPERMVEEDAPVG